MRSPRPPSSPISLGFLGRIVESKNVSFLIELLPILGPQFCLKIAGEGDCEMLKSRARELDVLQRVSFIGPLSEDQKWHFLESLDALCLPSKFLPGGQVEGFGIVLIEASVSGTPVIVSRYGGMQDFVLDHNGLCIDIDDLESSTAEITKFLNSPQHVARTVSNAQRLIKERLTNDQVSKRMHSNMIS